ncbi:MAG: hypothetical protein IPO17_04790 [Flavobacteriales bacterium]|nr:hypothetical protein [Flavobacteriales bacterium]
MPGSVELIADIGGSSSRWTLLDGAGQVTRLSSSQLPGFNPAVNSSDEFVDAIRSALRVERPIQEHITRITVYGAGCGAEERKLRMTRAVEAIAKSDKVVINTDLLGAARGLCGAAPGMVVIIGTGMNAGWYDGKDLSTPMPSLGWMLGDEGSGADIGKQLLSDAVHGRIPDRVMLAIFGRGTCSATEALQFVKSEKPNSVIAALAGKLSTVRSDPYVTRLLNARFTALGALLDQYFSAHFPCSVSATGGIAHGFREELGTCLRPLGLDLHHVMPDPMEGIIAWHRAHRPH